MDIVLVIVPRILDDFGYTPAGPALLKGALTANGFTSKILDFNADLESKYQNNQDQLIAISNYFMTHSFYNAELFKQIEKLIDEWSTKILELNPVWVGISVFTYDSGRASRLLAIRLKSKNPNIKIVFGGAGLDLKNSEQLRQDQIIDAYIQGEGELSLIELIKNNADYPGINGKPFEQITNIDSIPFPIYDDYELQTYTNKKGLVALPITGSRGCVRHCTFCDVASQWPKFKFRQGTNIANEIQHQVLTYGVSAFRFTDSLINGSLKAFRDMITELAKFRSTLPDDGKFIWDSHFIILGPQQMKPEMFDLMKASGAGTMLIGVESGSDSVRKHMKKGFKQSDLDYCMEQFDRCGIRTRFLMVVGYPTETLQDFQDTLDMFTKYKPYSDRVIIEEVQLGITLNLLPRTPLTDNKEEYGIIQNTNHINDWVCKSNPTLDFKERIKRRIYLQEHVERLGYRVFNSKNHTKELFISWNNIMKTNQKPTIVDDFIYDRERGGLIETPPIKKINITPIYEHKN
jgi:radical SAM superfamily enzyme YgiQ (UPF0313 family)